MKRRKFLTLLPAGIACAAVAPAILARGTQPQLTSDMIRQAVRTLKKNNIKGPYTMFVHEDLYEDVKFFEAQQKNEQKPYYRMNKQSRIKPYYRQHERY